MSLVRAGNVSTYESPAETIGALIERAWNTDSSLLSTDGVAIPKFIYDEDRREPENITQMQDAIAVRDLDTFPIPERTSSDGTLIGLGETVVIDVFAQSQLKRRLYETEIYRILKKWRPIGNNAPMLKKDNVSNSSIHDYDELLPEFVMYDDGKKGREMSSKSSAILTVLSELEFTP